MSAALKAALKTALRNSGDLAKSVAKAAARNIKRLSPSRLAKASKPDVPELTPQNLDDAVKAVDDLESFPLNGAKSTKGEPPPPPDPTTKMSLSARAAAQWAEVSPKVKGAIGTTVLAGVAVGTYLAIAGARLQNTDGVEVEITKIEKIKDTQNQYKFTYKTRGGQKCGTPAIPCIENSFNPCTNDTFTFRSTHTTPTMDDVTAVVIDVDDDAVSFELELTDMGDGTPEWGFMTCHTSFRNQFRSTVKETVQLIVDLAADIADPLVGGICDAISIPFICPNSLRLGNWVIWVIVACCLLMCCVGLILALGPTK
jgi:hypothetical protein